MIAYWPKYELIARFSGFIGDWIHIIGCINLYELYSCYY